MQVQIDLNAYAYITAEDENCTLGEDVHAKQQKGGEYVVAKRSLSSWSSHLSKT